MVTIIVAIIIVVMIDIVIISSTAFYHYHYDCCCDVIIIMNITTTERNLCAPAIVPHKNDGFVLCLTYTTQNHEPKQRKLIEKEKHIPWRKSLDTTFLPILLVLFFFPFLFLFSRGFLFFIVSSFLLCGCEWLFASPHTHSLGKEICIKKKEPFLHVAFFHEEMGRSRLRIVSFL